jgi:hypothetical protein
MPFRVIISLLILVRCAESHANVRGDSPEPYILIKCTAAYLDELNRQGKLPRWMVADWTEPTNVMLNLQERRRLEDGTR